MLPSADDYSLDFLMHKVLCIRTTTIYEYMTSNIMETTEQ